MRRRGDSVGAASPRVTTSISGPYDLVRSPVWCCCSECKHLFQATLSPSLIRLLVSTATFTVVGTPMSRNLEAQACWSPLGWASKSRDEPRRPRGVQTVSSSEGQAHCLWSRIRERRQQTRLKRSRCGQVGTEGMLLARPGARTECSSCRAAPTITIVHQAGRRVQAADHG